MLAMDTIDVESKRKKKKLTHACPNPLFEKWITEWRDEAAKKQWKTKYVYDKALQSLRKYPLVLKSGKDAKILEFFGDKICSMLDTKLAEHRSDQGESDMEIYQDKEDHYLDMCLSPAKTSSAVRANTSPKLKDKNTKGNSKQYIPVRRSGAYALLLTIYKFQLMDGYVGYMKKADLLSAAQPLCDKSFTIPDPGSHYTSWSSMGTLIKKHLVLKEGNPSRYSLTESGSELVEKILQSEAKLANTDTQSSTCSATYSSASASNIRSNLLTGSSRSSQSSQQSSGSCSDILAVSKFKLEPGQFEIILCVDNCETVGGAPSDRKQAVAKELKKNGVNFDVRKLNVGDFLWIAREKVHPIPGRLQLPLSRELVLDYIVERKRKDDLAGSIRDGRYNEQKFRLKHCGLRCPIYLIEEFGSKNTFSIPDSSLYHAISNTQIINGFTIKHTKDIFESVAYLTIMTRYLQSFYSNKILWSCTRGEIDHSFSDWTRREMELMTFEEFNANCIKNKSMTVTEAFIKQLLKVHGLSAEKVKAIIESFPTLRSLFNAYDSCTSEKEKENLIAEIKYGKCGRKLGPALSKVLYLLYNQEILH